MAVENSHWPLTAAAEIMTKVAAKTITSDFTVADVIERHCPFKADVTYMPVPQCKTCAAWTQRLHTSGWCHAMHINAPDSFGCVLWREK